MNKTANKIVKKTLFIAALGLCSLLARNATASQIDFVSMGKYASIQVSLNAYTYTGVGGELDWQWSLPPNTPGGVPTGYSPTFYAYCVDLLHYLTDPQTVTLRSTDDLIPSTVGVSAQGPYVADAGAKAAWLFNTYAPGINASGSGTDAAGLQVAIWEALYDSTDTLLNIGSSLTSGAFKLSADPLYAAVSTKAITYLTGLYSTGGASGTYKTSSATWLDATLGAGQDQIVFTPQVTVTSVPEPASIVFLGTGLLALAHGIRRRRAQKTAAAARNDQSPSA